MFETKAIQIDDQFVVTHTPNNDEWYCNLNREDWVDQNGKYLKNVKARVEFPNGSFVELDL